MENQKKIPHLNFMEKTRDSKYLKNYTLNYTNTAGKEKIYEIVSNFELADQSDLGKRPSGVVIVGYHEDKILLCKEFRMGINDFCYNLPAGHIDDGEDAMECAKRELYEETGLSIIEVIDVLPPSFGAPDITDSAAWLVMAKVEGEFADHTEANEWIEPGFFSKEEVRRMIREEKFSGRAQIIAWFFAFG
ncbi:MAG: NUDIX hydrolase [Eubacteriales bacterium]|nr:NUDIX hydrolase [Eubacteriales bacterium]